MNRLFLLLFGMVTFVAHAQVPDYVPTEGLVAWYPFNGNANDESGNGYHGLVDGVVTFDTSAAVFNGVGQINLPLDFDYEQRTVCTRVTPTDNFSPQVALVFDNGVLDYGLTSISYSNGCSAAFAGNLGGLNHCTGPIIEIATGICLVRDLDSSYVFVNGQLIASLPSMNIHSDFGNLLPSIGAGRTGEKKLYGEVDFVGLWNRALSPSEILSVDDAEMQEFGCLDPFSCNFSPETISNNPLFCEYGCLNCGPGTFWNDSLSQCLPSASICGEGTIWDASLQACVGFNDCPSDLDGDGLIGVEDLLSLLSDFGTDCVASDDPESAEWTCGDPLSYHSYDYATVQIGEQCWFAENLRTEHYRNQDSIATSLSNIEWAETTNGAQTILNNNFENLSIYGRLYNWYAVSDNRELCPIDWHIPADEEWIWLSEYLGGSGIAGEHLKTEYGWYAAGNGDNSSGFNGLPGGARNPAGNFQYGSGDHGLWWSSSLVGISAWGQYLVYSHPNIFGNVYGRNAGFSVRCVKDAE